MSFSDCAPLIGSNASTLGRTQRAQVLSVGFAAFNANTMMLLSLSSRVRDGAAIERHADQLNQAEDLDGLVDDRDAPQRLLEAVSLIVVAGSWRAALGGLDTSCAWASGIRGLP